MLDTLSSARSGDLCSVLDCAKPMLESLETCAMNQVEGGFSRISHFSETPLGHLGPRHRALFSHIQSLAIPALPLMPTCSIRLDMYLLNGRKNFQFKKNVPIYAKVGSKGGTFLLKTVVICLAHSKSDSDQSISNVLPANIKKVQPFPKKISLVENSK